MLEKVNDENKDDEISRIARFNIFYLVCLKRSPAEKRKNEGKSIPRE